eukprot:scaffold109_cov252-Pinguiococcus_pyrenoidosus.AAC.6
MGMSSVGASSTFQLKFGVDLDRSLELPTVPCPELASTSGPKEACGSAGSARGTFCGAFWGCFTGPFVSSTPASCGADTTSGETRKDDADSVFGNVFGLVCRAGALARLSRLPVDSTLLSTCERAAAGASKVKRIGCGYALVRAIARRTFSSIREAITAPLVELDTASRRY